MSINQFKFNRRFNALSSITENFKSDIIWIIMELCFLRLCLLCQVISSCKTNWQRIWFKMAVLGCSRPLQLNISKCTHVHFGSVHQFGSYYLNGIKLMLLQKLIVYWDWSEDLSVILIHLCWSKLFVTIIHPTLEYCNLLLGAIICSWSKENQKGST